MAKKILIIEDDQFLQGLVSRKFSVGGFETAVATNGIDGVRLEVSEKPDIILLDLLLPGSDGFEVLERMKKDEALKNIPVIVFSNLSEEKDIARAKDLGAISYMVKSQFTLDELDQEIKSILSGTKPADSFFKTLS